VGLGPDRTRLICKQSGPEFWDRTEVRSHGPVQSRLSYGPVQSRLSYGPVFIFETGLCMVLKKIGTGPHGGLVLFFETEPSQSGGKRPDRTVVDV
jgi:hypothetical protein